MKGQYLFQKYFTLLQQSIWCFALITAFPLPSLLMCFPSLADQRHTAVSLVPLSGFEEEKALIFQDPKPTVFSPACSGARQLPSGLMSIMLD